MWLWALLPICLAVFGSVGIWVVFGIAVSNDTVNFTVRFPYISECGTYDPQSCIFSQVCHISSFLTLWIVVIRFQQVRDYGHNSRVNIASIILGFISCLGISLIGNFQQSVFFGIHVFGAFLAFFVGLAYFWLQVWLTYKVRPSEDCWWVGPLRAALCLICSVLVVTSLVFDTGYSSVASISEWALVMSFFVLFGLFACEFRHIDCHQLTVQKRGLSEIYNTSAGGIVLYNTANGMAMQANN
ncbi:modulator of macroautophagy TMEM150B isoform X2 [Esox lucius]|uniref:CWH43-like N-terminal domain-containing protein n=1 Tax=Esox lucius TaxID=8010 RepID=A0A3P8Y3I5_ESOLU|nr:modulator of macroautophagy TMEM150B isoform X2 [Esox lucius]